MSPEKQKDITNNVLPDLFFVPFNEYKTSEKKP